MHTLFLTPAFTDYFITELVMLLSFFSFCALAAVLDIVREAYPKHSAARLRDETDKAKAEEQKITEANRKQQDPEKPTQPKQ